MSAWCYLAKFGKYDGCLDCDIYFIKDYFSESILWECTFSCCKTLLVQPKILFFSTNVLL
jgi:hypothetical protein